ncbi:MAG: hypothetical protein R3B72_05995 [Polyangiaceae bacterium]
MLVYPVRQAFLFIAATAVLAVPVAVGCGSPAAFERCPTDMPDVGDRCTDDGLACGYGPTCATQIRFQCDDGFWGHEPTTAARSTSCECPAVEPKDGTFCSAEGLSCGYGEQPCGLFARDLRCERGAWAVAENVCNTPFECPPELPENKSSCSVESYENPEECSYEVDGCTIVATCGLDTWEVSTYGCPANCVDYPDKAICDTDPACRWLVACGEPNEATVPTGCYPAKDCADDCAEGLTCQTVLQTPACAEVAALCLP